MKKRQNNLKSSLMLTGLSYGEHVMNADRVVDDLKATLKGCGNSFIVRCQPDRPMDPKMYLSIAEFAKQTGMPFGFLYAYQHPPKGKRSHLDAETVKAVEDIAGDLFLGEMFGEIGSEKVAKDYGYFLPKYIKWGEPLSPDATDMRNAREKLVSEIKKMTDYNKSIGLNKSMVVEATSLFVYDMEGGIDIPVLEVLPGDPEKLIPFTRGAAISYNKKMWGCFVAHEWYGGYRHFDELKKKRLDLTYKHLFMEGSNIAFLESGNTEIDSYGVRLEYDSELCAYYRKIITDFHSFTKNNPRPEFGPYTKVAFVLGEDDAYTDFMGGTAFEQFGREEWGRSDAERSWRILSEVYRSPDWHDPLSYDAQGYDLGHAPAYGSYDVIHAAASPEVFSQYSYLIFVGRNTMSEELYLKLCGYVENGGVLLMSCAHLSVDPARESRKSYVNGGDLTRLFGCVINGSVHKNHGVKFETESAVKGLKYPGTVTKVCDPLFTEGFTDYAKISLHGAKVKAELYCGFHEDTSVDVPVVIENTLGKGVSILLTNECYPGDPKVYPLYKTMVKALLTASHSCADVKVAGSDKIRFSLFYDEQGRERLYLLNTAYDVPSTAIIIKSSGEKITRTLDPCQLISVDL